VTTEIEKSTCELDPLEWEMCDSLTSKASASSNLEYQVFKGQKGWLWACLFNGSVLFGALPSHPYKSQGCARARAEQAHQDFEWFYHLQTI